MRTIAITAGGALAALAMGCGPVSAGGAAQDRDRAAAEHNDDRDASAEDRRSLDLAGFDRIAVGGVYALDVEVGRAFSVELSGSRFMLDRTRVRVEDGVLRLDHEERIHCPRDEECGAVRARITLPRLAGISIAGVSEDSRIAGIDAERFSLTVAGVGGVALAGRCGALDLDVAGVGDIDAEALRCADVEARVGGVGDVAVYASRSIDATVGGVGDIIVHGSPSQVSQRSGMLGEITIR